ncbi:ATP-binding protein [Nocardioides sp. 616]|uniref:ATP-binding protein n=1 Tax=Nocardioides sp. 616 TaxID=2268090 RepID=UPI000CE318D7|nr:ATP-binding protein [Nocardioides sp. 616]
MSTRVREVEDVWAVLLLVVLVFAAGCFALGVASPGTTALVTWWPAAGVATMLATVSRPSWWWWVLPAIGVANAGANLLFDRPWGIALVLSLVLMVEAVVFSLVLRLRQGGLAVMATQRDVLRLTVAATASACAGGLLGAVVLPWVGSTATFGDLLLTLTPSHVAAMLVVAPVVMSLRRPLLPILTWELVLQATSLNLAVLATFWLGQQVALTFVPLPFVVWAAFRFGLRVVAWQLMIVAVVATSSTALKHGPFAVGFSDDVSGRLEAASLVQVFLVCMVLICVPLAVNVEQGVRLTDRLRASSNLFRTNFAESLVAMLVLRDGRAGLEVFDANHRAAELLDRDVAEIVGSALADLVLTDLPLGLAADRMKRGELDAWRDEGSLTHRPTSRVALSIARLSGGDGESMYSAQLMDLTAERDAMAGLQAERQLSEMMLATTACMILVTDMDGSVLRANPAVTQILGHRNEALVGHPLWEVMVPPSLREGVRRMFQDSEGAGIPRSSESTARDTRGVEHRIAWTTGVVRDQADRASHLVLTGLDITAERHASGLMRHLLQAALTTALIGVDLRGCITLFNSGARTLLGQEPEEAVGTAFLDLLAPEDLAGWADGHAAAPTFDLVVEHLVDEPAREWRWAHADGRHSLVSMTLTSVRDHAGALIGYLCVGSDVTEMVQMQEMLMKALDKERQVVERLKDLDSAKDDFVSTVSHELRTPVSSIVGYTELLQDGDFGDLTQQQVPVLDAISRNGERLITLVDNLLALSGLSSDALTWDHASTDLAEVVLGIQRRFAGYVGQRRLEVTFTVPDVPVLVEGDSGQLDRALLNLLSNAVKFTEDGGRISCCLTTDDDHAVLVVRDDGLGIPREEQANLFGRFWRSSTSQARHIQGTGLGLSLVHAVVTAHRGAIDIESEHLQGTTVRVRIPLQRVPSKDVSTV